MAWSGAESRRRNNRLLLQRGCRIADREALAQILLKKLLEPIEPFILQRVDKFVENETAVVPAIRPNEDSVPQCEPGGKRRNQLGRRRRRAKHKILWNRNAGDRQQSDFAGMSDTNSCGIGSLRRGE